MRGGGHKQRSHLISYRLTAPLNPPPRASRPTKFNWKAFSGFKSEADVYAELAELYDDEVYAAQAQIGGARRRTSLQNSQPCCEWWGCVF